jgi:photosystem II stability/assembly factor-like uncharacterized protein
MSRIPLTLAALLVAAAVHAAPPPSYDDAALRAIQFVDDREGWAAGDDGTVWHSIDGGRTWERQKTGTRAALTGVHFLTPYTGFVSGRTELPGDLGSAGVLLATTDGGLTWNEVSNGLLPGLNGVTFFDDKTGLVVGDGCGAYPGGAFTTADGGKSWLPVVGPRGGSWLAADCANAKTGMLVGAWGQTATLRDGELAPTGLSVPGGRAVRALKSQAKTAFAVGDGGLVLANRDYPNGTWANVELPLPPEARGVCDFHAISVISDKVWLGGRPGSVVLASADGGKSWTVQRTDSHVPIHAIQMLNEKTGWAVGDLGTILMTTDGGAKWQHVRGKLHAAVLTAHATPKSVPLTMFPVIGAAEGYVTATVGVTTADAATADPRRAAEPFRLSAAIRLAGGAAAESLWPFPLPGHCDGLTADQLRTYWDRLHDGRAAEQLVRQMTLAVRLWRPEVIVTDSVMPDAPAAEQLVLAAMQEAFKRAADPAAFPEQLAALGLKPHAAKKLVGTTNEGNGHFHFDTKKLLAHVLETPETMTKDASLLIESNRQPVLRIVSHRMDAFTPPKEHLYKESPSTHLLDGSALAYGGMARRTDPIPESLNRWNPVQQAVHFKQIQRTRQELRSVLLPDTRHVTEASLSAFRKELVADKSRPLGISDSGMILAIARELGSQSPWTTSRELYQVAVDFHPTDTDTLPAYRWLARFHASSETLRRVELGQMASLRPTEFYDVPPGEIQQVAHAEAKPERAKFRTADARRDWFGTGPSLEAKLFAVSPLLSREPAEQLAYNAARLKLGLTADAEKTMANYYRAVVGRPVTAGANPWFDAVAAELFLMNRRLMPTCPKPMAACAKLADRPVLDGKLDDDVWKAATELSLNEGTKELAATHGTAARLAFDDEYLYLGVTCRHPNGEQVPAADKRKHDDDVTPHDRVELLLDLDRDYATYYRLRVDHRGCTAEDCWGDASWNPTWYVAVSPSPAGWTAEVAIPLSELTGSRPRDKHVWAANVTRVVPGRGVLSWSGPADATPRPEGLGLLEFRAK